MNNNTKLLKTRFPRPTRFAVRPALASSPRGRLDADLEKLKSRLLDKRLAAARSAVPGGVLRQAADEAASLAWLTPFPLLVLPALFDELADTAQVRARKQAEIRQRSHLLLAA
jgi:hypothetical protein